MNYYKEIEKVSEYESDLTFLVYEKFVLECIPKIIESAIKDNNYQIQFAINYDNIQLTFGEGMHKGTISAVSKIWPDSIINIDFGPYEINVLLFMELLSRIPNIDFIGDCEDDYMGVGENGKLKYLISTTDLIDYYYEELQRIEYSKTSKTK